MNHVIAQGETSSTFHVTNEVTRKFSKGRQNNSGPAHHEDIAVFCINRAYLKPDREKALYVLICCSVKNTKRKSRLALANFVPFQEATQFFHFYFGEIYWLEISTQPCLALWPESSRRSSAMTSWRARCVAGVRSPVPPARTFSIGNSVDWKTWYCTHGVYFSWLLMYFLFFKIIIFHFYKIFALFAHYTRGVLYCPAVFAHFSPAPVKTDRTARVQ